MLDIRHDSTLDYWTDLLYSVMQPVDSQTFNYSIVAVGIVVVYSIGFWVISARKWFTGPVKQIEGEHASLLKFWIAGRDNSYYQIQNLAEGMGIDVMDPANADKFEKMPATSTVSTYSKKAEDVA